MAPKRTIQDINEILRINPIGHVILPILKQFDHLDSSLYGDIATALFRSYEAGMKGVLSDLTATSKDVGL